MLRSFTDLIFGNEALAFESDFGLDESVRRLAAEIDPPFLGLRSVLSMRAHAVTGNVAEEHVSLWCETMPRNAFRPMFVGSFQVFDKRVILVGKMAGKFGMDHLGAGALLVVGFLWIVGTLPKLTERYDNPGL